MRDLVFVVIRDHFPKGAVIRTQGLYALVYSLFPKECQVLGLTNSGPIEPKWKYQIRWGLQDAKNEKLIKHVGLRKSGEWQRL